MVDHPSMAWLEHNWEELVFSYGPVTKPIHVSHWFEEMAMRYEEKHRHYHTFKHIERALRAAYHLSGSSYGWGTDIRPAELALYFHDVVYDPQSKTNEEESAEFAWKCLADLEFPRAFIGEIEAMILCTKTHEPDGVFQEIVVDADLSTLAIPWDQYMVYCAQVTSEYSFVPEDKWILGRIEFLESMIKKDRIFWTPAMQEKDILAKTNMMNELEIWLLKKEVLGL